MDRGYSAKILDKNEIKSLEPNLKDIPKEAIFTSLEGVADADRVALEMLKQLAIKGGKVLSGCTVLGLTFKKSRVSAVQTNIGEMQCDMVLLPQERLHKKAWKVLSGVFQCRIKTV